MIKKKGSFTFGGFYSSYKRFFHENRLFILNVHDTIQTNCENVFGLNDLLYVLNINII